MLARSRRGRAQPTKSVYYKSRSEETATGLLTDAGPLLPYLSQRKVRVHVELLAHDSEA